MSKISDYAISLINSNSRQYQSLNGFEQNNGLAISVAGDDKTKTQFAMLENVFEEVTKKVGSNLILASTLVGYKLDVEKEQCNLKNKLKDLLAGIFKITDDTDKIHGTLVLTKVSEKDSSGTSSSAITNSQEIKELTEKLANHLINTSYTKIVELFKDLKVIEINNKRSEEGNLAYCTMAFANPNSMFNDSRIDFKEKNNVEIASASDTKFGRIEYTEIFRNFISNMHYELENLENDTEIHDNPRESVRYNLKQDVHRIFNTEAIENNMYTGLVFIAPTQNGSQTETKEISPFDNNALPKIKELCEKLTDHLMETVYDKAIECYNNLNNMEKNSNKTAARKIG